MPAFTAQDLKRVAEAEPPRPEPADRERLVALAESLAGHSAQSATSPVVFDEFFSGRRLPTRNSE